MLHFKNSSSTVNDRPANASGHHQFQTLKVIILKLMVTKNGNADVIVRRRVVFETQHPPKTQ
jgi:hypothetical protein